DAALERFVIVAYDLALELRVAEVGGETLDVQSARGSDAGQHLRVGDVAVVPEVFVHHGQVIAVECALARGRFDGDIRRDRMRGRALVARPRAKAGAVR